MVSAALLKSFQLLLTGSNVESSNVTKSGGVSDILL